MNKIPTLIVAFLILASNLLFCPVLANNSKGIGVSALVLESLTALSQNGTLDIQTNARRQITAQKLTFSGRKYIACSLTF